jgi:uncharacterized coiled-coil protein SlyX
MQWSMKIEKRIEELKYRIEKCGSTLSELEENVRRLKRMMSLYIEEKNKLELVLKGDASTMEIKRRFDAQ